MHIQVHNKFFRMKYSDDRRYWIGLYVPQGNPAIYRTDFNWIKDLGNKYGIDNPGKWALNRPDSGTEDRCVYTRNQAWTDTECFTVYAFTVCQCRNCLISKNYAENV